MKKKLLAMLLSMAVLGSITGCSGGGSDEPDKLVVGSVIMNTSGEWFAEIMQGMEAAGEDLGVKVNIVSSDNEISKESDNVATFVAQGADAITICPISADASSAAVESARAEGIPVVTWNTTVNSQVDSHVGVSNYDLGKLTGEYVAEYVAENYPDGCKLAILGNSSYEIGVERCNGFKDAIKNVAGLEIVAEQDAEMQDEGLDITEQILTATPDVDIFWAWNQTSLLGCATHMQNIRNKDIVIMGTDMSVDLAKTMLGDSVTLQAITTQKPFDIGYNAVNNAVKLINGEEVEKVMSIELQTYIKDDAEGLNAYIEDRKSLME
ncbi:hypothetical protein AN639_02840 [Candidatus Epulonipiscium fishelsonii]|uniref:Uncharacterized protein n=1 Tax=Candidatus Epulonipiscium fishelsonii TaxID=77094 RepID=A0ACC8XD31_9FIRM|nr:hypothetical protein AN396_05530 [Epulopiscium sp. SCG-B11WGA-EpuloA1]ONI41768.1 hypothetical protein AN639_02840 [Epulopiscium sp. SCG-B05WGA-EpuloA1]